MNTIRYLLLILLVAILVGCNPTPVPLSSDVLRDFTCSPPCWKGIVPGVTTSAEAKDILIQLSTVDAASINIMTTRVANDTIDFDFLPSIREHSGRIISRGDVVQCISFYTQRISASQIHEVLGAPDSYLSIYYDVERMYFFTIFIYNKGILYYLFRDGSISRKGVPTLKDDFLVEGFLYCNPNNGLGNLTNGLLFNFSEEELSMGIQPWDESAEFKYLKKTH